ncbi:hypothetical protein, partial [Sphingobacterium griseoflavum]
MTTFEDFFAKKKIDILLLRSEELALYEEFRLHYAQMGEKSFDHTKKFWFNKLRKKYLLIEPEVEKSAPTVIAKADAPAPVLESVTKKPTGFKPRFRNASMNPTDVPQEEINSKENSLTQKEKETPETEAITESQPNKPAGFKPRFKAGVTKPATPEPAQKPDAPTE